MPTKPPLGATLELGVRQLSADQTLNFYLYRRYIFPLDGMNYWIKVPGSGTVTTAGISPGPGLVSRTADGGAAIQVVPGGIGALNIAGGTIVNPQSAADQGLPTAEPLFVDFTGPAYSHVTGTTKELQPGQSITFPASPANGIWVCSSSDHHKFTCVVEQSVPSVTMPVVVQVVGSFHYSVRIDQMEDATVDSNTCIFTSLTEIQPFNQIGPDYLYICHYDDIDLTFAFSSRGRLYQQADLYHYQGVALKSRHLTQIIDDYTTFNPTLAISNSLPIWLNMPNYVPPYPGFICEFPLYPSYLVDDNLPPPFGAVHIDDTETMELGIDWGPRWQQSDLCREKVTIHLYGVDHAMASDFVSFVQQYSLDWMKLGLVSTPAIKDIKLPQEEFKILAQRKQIVFDINYRQNIVRDEARQFILGAKVQWIPQWLTGDP